MIKKLERMPYAQAHVEINENGNITLVSYTTVVATIVDGWLSVYGLYSQTTRKHISAFVREYTPFEYSTAKALYEDNESINIYTGELIDRA